MIEHILVTTDFSECAEAALAAAANLQLALSCRVTLVSVVANPKHSSAASQGLDEGVANQLASLRNKYFAHVIVRTELLNEERSVAEEIVHFADINSVDLIVIACHGKRGFRRLVLGSVTEEVVRRAGCPVLIVPQAEQPREAEHEGIHFVVATDLSSESEEAFPIARELFKTAGSTLARLTLLHVAENMAAATFNQTFGVGVEAIRSEGEEEAEKKLEQIANTHFHGMVVMTTVLRAAGTVDEEIIDYLESHDTDLLILARKTPSALERLVAGSVTEKLIRQAKRKVLVVPAAK